MSNKTPFEKWWNDVGSGIALMFYPENKAVTKNIAWEAWSAAKADALRRLAEDSREAA